MGYPTEMFEANPLLDRLQCAICSDVLFDPQLLVSCRHRFCRECIMESMRRDTRCPICRTEIVGGRSSSLTASAATAESFTPSTLMVDDVTAKDLIQECLVKCKHRAAGCDWVGSLSNQKDHLKVTCGYEFVKCDNASKGCPETHIRRREKGEHLKNCEYRQVSCVHCKLPVLHKDLQVHHQRYCQEIVVACPNKCGANLKLKRIPKHIADECRLTEIPCQFALHGCTVKMLREHQDEHNKQYNQQHMQLLCASMNKLARTTQQLQEENKRLKEENKRLFSSLASQITEQGKKLKQSEINKGLVVREVCFEGIDEVMKIITTGQSVMHVFKAYGRRWAVSLYPNGIAPMFKDHLSLSIKLDTGANNNNNNNNNTAPLAPCKVTVSVKFINQDSYQDSVKFDPVQDVEFSAAQPTLSYDTALSHMDFYTMPGLRKDGKFIVRIKFLRTEDSPIEDDSQQHSQPSSLTQVVVAASSRASRSSNNNNNNAAAAPMEVPLLDDVDEEAAAAAAADDEYYSYLYYLDDNDDEYANAAAVPPPPPTSSSSAPPPAATGSNASSARNSSAHLRDDQEEEDPDAVFRIDEDDDVVDDVMGGGEVDDADDSSGEVLYQQQQRSRQPRSQLYSLLTSSFDDHVHDHDL